MITNLTSCKKDFNGRRGNRVWRVACRSKKNETQYVLIWSIVKRSMPPYRAAKKNFSASFEENPRRRREKFFDGNNNTADSGEVRFGSEGVLRVAKTSSWGGVGQVIACFSHFYPIRSFSLVDSSPQALISFSSSFPFRSNFPATPHTQPAFAHEKRAQNLFGEKAVGVEFSTNTSNREKPSNIPWVEMPFFFGRATRRAARNRFFDFRD